MRRYPGHYRLPTSCHLLKIPEYRGYRHKSIILFEIAAVNAWPEKDPGLSPGRPFRPHRGLPLKPPALGREWQTELFGKNDRVPSVAAAS